MFGILRFFLALTVVVYHMGYHPMGLYIGVSAVMVFYMISGYVISALYSSRFISIKNARHFYIERFIRIAPQYYFYLAIALLLFYKDIYMFSSTGINAISNVALIPLGFSEIFSSLHLFAIIPPTFSLANEFLLYLISPIILVFPVAALIVLSLSLGVFILASHGLILMPDTYFFVFPGPLIFFLLGHFIRKSDWKCLVVTVIVLTLNFSHLAYTQLAASGYINEIYLGLYSGVFLLLLLRNRKPRLIDNWLGAVSYGCFLSHMLLHIVLSHYWKASSPLLYNFVLIFLSVACGCLSFLLIEWPTIKYRSHLRNKNSFNGSMENRIKINHAFLITQR